MLNHYKSVDIKQFYQSLKILCINIIFIHAKLNIRLMFNLFSLIIKCSYIFSNVFLLYYSYIYYFYNIKLTNNYNYLIFIPNVIY